MGIQTARPGWGTKSKVISQNQGPLRRKAIKQMSHGCNGLTRFGVAGMTVFAKKPGHEDEGSDCS